jgi:hypothetical protein
MGDEAVDSMTSASDHSSSPPIPWRPTSFIVVAPSRLCGVDCILCYRARDLSVGFDLGIPPLLRAGPCERWAQSRCFGRVFNERTNVLAQQYGRGASNQYGRAQLAGRSDHCCRQSRCATLSLVCNFYHFLGRSLHEVLIRMLLQIRHGLKWTLRLREPRIPQRNIANMHFRDGSKRPKFKVRERNFIVS